MHALPLLQAVPGGATGFEQLPSLWHVPATWHWSLAVHVFGVPPPQAPAVHVSPLVHALPSLHEAPFGAAGFEQLPSLWHVPATWH
jgi:hypothetical protein